MSMTEDVWDCRFCIASGKNIIWNAKKDGGNPQHADRKQLTRSWLTHQGICKNRKSADFAKKSSSTSSTSAKRRALSSWISALMIKDGLIKNVPKSIWWIDTTPSQPSLPHLPTRKGNKKTEGAYDNEDIIKDGGQRYTRDCFYLEEGRLIDSKGRVWFPCILECAESSNDKRKLKAIKLIPSNEEGKQEGDLKQQEQEGVPKRQKQSSSTTEGNDNDIYENFVCYTI